MSNPLSICHICFAQAVCCLRLSSVFTSGFHNELSCFFQWPPLCYHDSAVIRGASVWWMNQVFHSLSLHSCEGILTSPRRTSHLKDYVQDLFRTSSSGEVFLWKPTEVPAPQCLVNSMNEGLNHLSHVGSEWVKWRLLGSWALEMPILVALGTKQPFLSHSDV